MIEVGKTYKLIGSKKFPGEDIQDDYKVLKIQKDGFVFIENTRTGDGKYVNIDSLIDPEKQEETVWEKLNIVMKPMNLTFWKDLQEEASFGSLGAAPTPAITSGCVQGTTVNGIPVEGKSVKKKKKSKKNEEESIFKTYKPSEKDINFATVEKQVTPGEMLQEIEDTFDTDNILVTKVKNNREIMKISVCYDKPGHGMLHKLKIEFLDIDEETVIDEVIEEDLSIEDCIKELEYIFQTHRSFDVDEEFLDSPKQVFLFDDAKDREIEYEDALNLLLYGKDELDKKEYTCMLKFFKNCNVLGEFKKFAKEKGIDNIHPDNIGSQLSEDFEDEHVEKSEQEENIDIKTLLIQAQAEENTAIASYLDKANKCKKLGNDKLEKLFKELADDETVHVGCLQGALDNLGIADLDKIIDGQTEANELLNGENIEDVIESLLNEDFNEAYERITNLLAKQLDRMNFEFANTEEIIYKKEGKYKYLLKFDNQDGYLKFKVSQGDNTLVEKEWKLEEKEDVSPIFQEIEDIYNEYGI